MPKCKKLIRKQKMRLSCTKTMSECQENDAKHTNTMPQRPNGVKLSTNTAK